MRRSDKVCFQCPRHCPLTDSPFYQPIIYPPVQTTELPTAGMAGSTDFNPIGKWPTLRKVSEESPVFGNFDNPNRVRTPDHVRFKQEYGYLPLDADLRWPHENIAHDWDHHDDPMIHHTTIANVLDDNVPIPHVSGSLLFERSLSPSIPARAAAETELYEANAGVHYSSVEEPDERVDSEEHEQANERAESEESEERGRRVDTPSSEEPTGQRDDTIPAWLMDFYEDHWRNLYRTERMALDAHQLALQQERAAWKVVEEARYNLHQFEGQVFPQRRVEPAHSHAPTDGLQTPMEQRPDPSPASPSRPRQASKSHRSLIKKGISGRSTGPSSRPRSDIFATSGSRNTSRSQRRSSRKRASLLGQHLAQVVAADHKRQAEERKKREQQERRQARKRATSDLTYSSLSEAEQEVGKRGRGARQWTTPENVEDLPDYQSSDDE